MTGLFISITLFAITTLIGPVDSFFESCIGERCFTIPRSNEMKNFSDARLWCEGINSNLTVVPDENTQDALTQFLNSAQLNEHPISSMFIDLKLERKDQKWYFVNGEKYDGGIACQKEGNYCLYGYTDNIGNGFKVKASQPNSVRNFICEFENTSCSNKLSNNYLYKERCFVNFDNENHTWYKARESCHNNRGDLATFNCDSYSTDYPCDVPFNTSWLNSALSYWVGIRWEDRRWTSSGDGEKSIYTRWSIGKPNNAYYECVCVDPNGKPAWGWTDCNCTEPREFVCMKIVPTPIATTTSDESDVRNSPIAFSVNSTVPTSIVATTSDESEMTNSSSAYSVNSAIIVGLILGIAVILPLLIIILILAIIIRRLKQSRESTENNGSVVSLSRTMHTEHNGTATQLEAAAPALNYQRLRRETMFPSGSTMPLYDQLNQPENGDYELPQ